MKATNPATNELIKEYQDHAVEEAERMIEDAHKAFLSWRRTGFQERATLMRKAAGILKDRKEEYGRLMAEEMGKPLAAGIAECEKCAWVCEYYADNAENFLADEAIETDADRSYVAYQPIGVVLAVMPWNFPFWQVFRFAAPNLMAGNTGILKHASNVPGCALAIEDIFKEAGFPEGCFTTLLVGSKHADRLIEHPRVKAVTLTGSTPAGKAVAEKAGSVLKKTVLELGGSDPYVICQDADLEQAAKACVQSRMINSGQSCIAAKRFIVTRENKERFEELMVEGMKAKNLGDPLAEGTDIGPQARTDLRDDLHRQVEESIGRGAKLLLGGSIPDKEGAWYPATVLTDVRKGIPAYDEELFGPVAAIIPVENEDEAVEVANDTVFGLGAAVFTNDTKKGERMAKQIEAGCTFVNQFVKSDPRLPFGGIKQSGYGRELGEHGIKEFVNAKTVWIRDAE